MRTIISDMPNRRNFLKGRYTIEIGYPWLTYGAIMELEEFLTPNFKVLEFGCGGSTIFFSRRCKSVKSMESNEVWADKVRGTLSASSNVEIICCDFAHALATVKAEPTEYYDLILVDSDTACTSRLQFMIDASPKLKVGGYLILDNYDHRKIRGFDYTGWNVFTYDGIRHSGRGTRICIKNG